MFTGIAVRHIIMLTDKAISRAVRGYMLTYGKLNIILVAKTHTIPLLTRDTDDAKRDRASTGSETDDDET